MTKKPSRTKVLTQPLAVPQSRPEAARAVARVGEIRRDMIRIEAEMNDRIAQIRESYETASLPLRDEFDREVEALRIWAEANRQMLTNGDKTKYVDLGTGLIKWRLRPPAVRLKAVDAVLDSLRGLGLTRFIRVKEEVNKDAMLADTAVARTVPGVTISSAGEDFVVEPLELELAAETAR